MEILIRPERGIIFILEQPVSSWAFKMPFMQALQTLAGTQLGQLLMVTDGYWPLLYIWNYSELFGYIYDILW